MTQTAADCFTLHLRVGRSLPAPLLAGAVALRELVTAVLLQGGLTGLLAPAWVVVRDRDGRVVLRAPAGRQPEAGPELLADMRAAAVWMTPERFLERFARWD